MENDDERPLMDDDDLEITSRGSDSDSDSDDDGGPSDSEANDDDELSQVTDRRPVHARGDVVEEKSEGFLLDDDDLERLANMSEDDEEEEEIVVVVAPPLPPPPKPVKPPKPKKPLPVGEFKIPTFKFERVDAVAVRSQRVGTLADINAMMSTSTDMPSCRDLDAPLYSWLTPVSVSIMDAIKPKKKKKPKKLPVSEDDYKIPPLPGWDQPEPDTSVTNDEFYAVEEGLAFWEAYAYRYTATSTDRLLHLNKLKRDIRKNRQAADYRERKKQYRHLVVVRDSGFAITPTGVYIANWSGHHDGWVQAFHLALLHMYSKETRAAYKDLELNPTGRRDYMAAVLCALNDVWHFRHTNAKLGLDEMQVKAKIPTPESLANALVKRELASSQALSKRFYLLTGLTGRDVIAATTQPLIESTLALFLNKLSHSAPEDLAVNFSPEATQGLLNMDTSKRLFVFEFMQSNYTSKSPLFAVHMQEDPHPVLGIGLSYRVWNRAGRGMMFRTAEALQLLLLHALAKVLTVGLPNLADPAYKHWQRANPSVGVLFATETLTFYRAFHACINLAYGAGTIVALRVEPWWSFEQVTVLRQLETRMYVSELVSLQVLDRHPRRGMKRTAPEPMPEDMQSVYLA